MCPPGLAFVALNDRAWRAAAAARCPRFYWDLPTERGWQAKHQGQFTPAVSLLAGLDVALGLIRAEGLAEVYRRHDRLARAARAAADALGLALFARATPSPAVTAIVPPAGIDGEAIVRAYGAEDNITIAGGQGEMKGKLFRLAHLGWVDESDLIVGLASLERVLVRLGVPVELGAAVAAAQRIFVKES